jgi:glycerol-3-phosphate dehydrogenase (NAD(P)+)
VTATAGAGPVAVVGAGSWGTALALLLAGKGLPVRLWSFEADVVSEIREHGENRSFLSGFRLPELVEPTHHLDHALDGARVVVSVSPSQHAGGVLAGALDHLDPEALVVTASKGIEIATLRTMDQVLEELLPEEQHRRLVVISGPSFAAEVAAGLPTAVVVASRDGRAALEAQALFQTPAFRVYTNDDVMGVELGGAVKNVVALAAGVASGLGFGHNTLAALITRGLAEITRLGLVMGARQATFSGLAGMGDLVLTCTGDLSRNRTVGTRLGQGEALADILGDMRAVAEGVRTAPAVRDLARRHGVEMPIVEEVCAILEGVRSPSDAVRSLMLRDPKPEDWV